MEFMKKTVFSLQTTLQTLLILGASAAGLARAHDAHASDDENYYFRDQDDGRYIGQTHIGKREGRCAEVTPKNTVYKDLDQGKCDD